MIITLGYVIIGNMQEKRCDVQRVQFSTQLATYIDTNRGWGTIKEINLKTLPCDTTHICFIDRRAVDTWPEEGPPDEWSWVEPPPGTTASIMEASAESGDPTNVFTIQNGNRVEPVERFSGVGAPIEVVNSENQKPKGTCLAANQGTLQLILKGTGTSVQVEKLT